MGLIAVFSFLSFSSHVFAEMRDAHELALSTSTIVGTDILCLKVLKA